MEILIFFGIFIAGLVAFILYNKDNFDKAVKEKEIRKQTIKQRPTEQAAPKPQVAEINLKKIGKIITYDGATGNGKILLRNGEKVSFDIDSWSSTDSVPAIGLDVVLEGDKVFANKAAAMVSGATKSVAQGMGTGVGLVIVVIILMVLLIIIWVASQGRF